MFKPFHRDQAYLLPPSLHELIPEGDLVYVVAEAVELLDLHPLYERYHRLGQNAYHPGMLLGILFYAYARGVFASRRIADQLGENVRFMYLAGMQRPDFRTICDFRKDHSDLLKAYFVQIVQICQAAGMTSLGALAIDGSKIKASASRGRQISREALTGKLDAVVKEIDILLEAAAAADRADEASSSHAPAPEPQITKLSALRTQLRAAKDQLDTQPRLQRINTTDPDCRLQPKVGPGYNAQIAVDCDSQIVVSASVVAEENDAHQLLPMIASAQRNTHRERQPQKILADSGYASAAAFTALESQPHLDSYVPTREQTGKAHRRAAPFDKSKFTYDLKTETGVCPAGHPLRLLRRGTNKSGERYLHFIGTACSACPSRPSCTRARYRSLVVLRADQALKRMEHKMATPAGREAMRRRKQTAEPVFGTLKEHMGFRSFRLRGLLKVNGEFALLCAAFNLKKLHRWLHQRSLAERLNLKSRLRARILEFLAHKIWGILSLQNSRYAY